METHDHDYNDGINNEIARPAGDLAPARSAGALGLSDLARPGWLDLASTGSIWLPLACGWLENRFGWLDLVALCAPGRLAGSI